MEDNRDKKRQIVKDIISYTLIVVAVILIRVFIFDPVRVDGDSMNNTLADGEIIIFNKIKDTRTDTKRYDVVVMKIGDRFT